MKKFIAMFLIVCLCIANAQIGFAKDLGDLFGNIGSVFGQSSPDKTDENASDSVLKNASTIISGLFSADTDIPKTIHYDDFELFKQEIDTLEQYFQSYVDFMKAYDASDLSMLNDYLDLMAKYTEAMQVLEALDESKMTRQEKTYYTKVQLRIDKMLFDML